jgi:hypothetical protein
MMTAGVLNFFAWIGVVLILPLFQRTPGLGPVRYRIISIPPLFAPSIR